MDQKTDREINQAVEAFKKRAAKAASVAVASATRAPKDATVQVTLEPGAKMPHRATGDAAGFDLTYWHPEKDPIWIGPGERARLDTGLSMAIPKGFEGQIRSRSGLAFTKDIDAFPGTIDADYRGRIFIRLHNMSDKPYQVKHGERIAQIVISRVPTVAWEEVEYLPKATTNRVGGLGSTGK